VRRMGPLCWQGLLRFLCSEEGAAAEEGGRVRGAAYDESGWGGDGELSDGSRWEGSQPCLHQNQQIGVSGDL
jgi:hypothetical protein